MAVDLGQNINWGNVFGVVRPQVPDYNGAMTAGAAAANAPMDSLTKMMAVEKSQAPDPKQQAKNLEVLGNLAATVTDDASYQNAKGLFEKAGGDIKGLPETYDENAQKMVQQLTQYSRGKTDLSQMTSDQKNASASGMSLPEYESKKNKDVIDIADKKRQIQTQGIADAGLLRTIDKTAEEAVVSQQKLELLDQFNDLALSGKFAEAEKIAAQVGGALGNAKASEIAAKSEAFSALSQQLKFSEVQKLRPASDTDIKLAEKAIPSLSNTPEGRKLIGESLRIINSQATTRRDFARNYYEKNGTLTGADEAFGKMLKDNPVLITSFESPDGSKKITEQQINQKAKELGKSPEEVIQGYGLKASTPKLNPEIKNGYEKHFKGYLKRENAELPFEVQKKNQVDEQKIQNTIDVSKSSNPSAMKLAEAYVGATEGRDRAILAQTFKKSLGEDIDPVKVAWCAAFVNSIEKSSGRSGTSSLAARSFLNYGQPTASPTSGDIVVLSRGSDPSKGHVGFFAGYDKDGNVKVLGGNQDDSVSIKSYPKGNVLGFRVPPAAEEIGKGPQSKEPDINLASRGLRNNNPGNLIKSSATFQGEVSGSDKRFRTFETPEHGIAATLSLLQKYAGKGRDSVEKIVSAWAPPSENNTAKYIKDVSKLLGVKPTDTLNLDDPKMIANVAYAIIKKENGRVPYKKEQFEKALALYGEQK
jgi:uncharacterized protein (TIGR02594 family)